MLAPRCLPLFPHRRQDPWRNRHRAPLQCHSRRLVQTVGTFPCPEVGGGHRPFPGLVSEPGGGQNEALTGPSGSCRLHGAGCCPPVAWSFGEPGSFHHSGPSSGSRQFSVLSQGMKRGGAGCSQRLRAKPGAAPTCCHIHGRGTRSPARGGEGKGLDSTQPERPASLNPVRAPVLLSYLQLTLKYFVY